MSEDGDPRPDDALDYVLGVGPAGERAHARARMATDAAFAADVRAWEERLAPMAEAVPAVHPPTGMLHTVLAAIDGWREAGPSTPATSPTPTNVVALRRSRGRWRGAAAAAMALAASLAVYVAVTQWPASGGRYLAVVNRSGDLPALIVRVDQKDGTVTVRSLATETPAGRSLELWSIVGNGPPRSLGLIGPGGTRVAMSAADRPHLGEARMAVTVEPPGGSGSAGPTGPVVYSGRLVPESP